jgi:hypothetical protein
MNNTPKTANQLYRESGTTLPFKEWIEREKAKGIYIPNVEANKEMLNMLGDEGKEPSGSGKNVMVRNVLFGIGILSLVYLSYRLIKAKNA